MRFSAEYDQLVEQIVSREGWTAEQFRVHQSRQLREVVELATTRVPHYREMFAKTGVVWRDIRTPEDLPRLPILDKAAVRAEPLRFLDETLDRRKLALMHTSGTTGTPLDIYRSSGQQATAFAYLDARLHRQAGLRRRGNRSVSIGGSLVTAPGRTKPPFWVLNRRWQQLYMSSYHLSEANLPAYVQGLREFGPDYIEGYPSSVYAVARHIVDHGLAPVPMRAAFTTAETLFDYQRQAIAQAFGCRTYNQYGCGEMCLFAAECEAGSMHLSPEVGIVEIVDDAGQPLPAGQVGQVVCTGLVNRVQPFFRYRLGDLASLSATPCTCGKGMPVLERIEGRIDAVLVTRDGRRVGRLDPVFKGARGIAEAQIVQDDYDAFRIRIVPSSQYTDADGKAVVASLMERVGQANVRVEIVRQIERTAAGKFLAVVSNLPR